MRKVVAFEFVSLDGDWRFAPVVAGRGRRLFDGVPTIRFDVIRTVTSPTGHLLLDYRPIEEVDRSNR